MRPRIVCHMIASVDGRSLTGRWIAPDGGSATDLVWRVYEDAAVRLGRRGWIVGRTTMARYVAGERSPATRATSILRAPYVGNHADRSLAIVFDRQGKLLYGSDEVDGDHVVAVLSDTVDDKYLANLRDIGVSYVFSGPNGDDLGNALASIRGLFETEQLVLEGGGTLNGAFHAADLIDEFSTLIFPMIDGESGVPAIVNRIENHPVRSDAPRSLKLVGTEVLEAGVVWLRHVVVRHGA